MNPRAPGTVETEEIRRPLSPVERFHNFNFNVLDTIHSIVQGLLDILVFSAIRGCLYFGFLIEWVRRKSGHKGRMKSKDLVTGRFLGQGCSGIFYETDFSGSQESTVGLVRKDFPGVESGIFESEVVRLFELKNHSNIVKTLGWTVDSRSCSVVLERMRDDLASIMRREKEALRSAGTSPAPIKLLKAMDIALQIAIGMEYLHDQGIVHGNLKPNNVLVEYWDEDSMLVKLADYGLVETKKRTTLTSQRALCFGMIEWSAPEVFEDYFGSISEDLDYLKLSPPMSVSDNISSSSNVKNCAKLLMTKADSFSFALTCTYILVGGQVWDAKLSPHELRRGILCSGLRPKLPPECPEKLASLISKCWDASPTFRPTFSVIRNKLQEIIKEQREGEAQWHTRNILQEIIKEERESEAQRDLRTKVQEIVKEQREQDQEQQQKAQGDMFVKLQEIIKEQQEIRNKLQENVKEQQHAQQDIRVKLQEVIKEQQDIYNKLQENDKEQQESQQHIRVKLQEVIQEQQDIHNKLQDLLKEQARQVEKDVTADSSSLKLMESAEPISQLSEALRIIEDVTKTSQNFLMNKHQCERLVNRLHAIGMELRELPKEFLGRQFLDASNKFDNPAFDVLLAVLREAKALLSEYAESKESIPSMLTRTEDREAFKEIHAKLDVLNFLFPIGESTSASMRRAMLRRDAEMDLKELSESLHELARSDEGRQDAENVSALESNPSSTSRIVEERDQNACLRDGSSKIQKAQEPLSKGPRHRVSKPSAPTLGYNSNMIEKVSDHTISVISDKDRKCRARIDWVIGLDFGSTYSGFAYARVGDNPDIYLCYEWPGNDKPYCKTLTGSYYKHTDPGHLECTSWGYSARSEYMDHLHGAQRGGHPGLYLTKFKLLLKKDVQSDLMRSIPAPLTVTGIITDYLKLIGEHALSVMRNHVGGAVFSKDSVLWCVTVPSIWDENAKQRMKACMVNAGLVSAEAGGIEAVKVVLEPEAASFHCLQIIHEDVSLNVKDKILVADVGGGTVDIVVQELVGNNQKLYQVKELTESSGGLCGGTFVDDSFMRFLSKKIGCLDEFLRNDYPSYKTRLLKDWEAIKCSFGHGAMPNPGVTDICLHNKLATKREAYERDRGNTLDDCSIVELTEEDLKSIFDPVVDEILELIDAQLSLVPDIKVMFVVGGFAGSLYVMQRIRARFSSKVTHIVSPPNPGSAIVQGAVSLALLSDAIVSRISKKTYGTNVILPFDHALDPKQFHESDERGGVL